jgi:HD-GYP domain-containing protein (c-di-GMP phosphodiesterase class II)
MSKIERYVLGIAGLSASAAALVYTDWPVLPISFVRIAVVFGAIGLLARLLRHRIGRASSGSLAFIPMLASATMAPHWVTVACVAAVVALDQLVARNDWKKLVFNVGQYSFSISIAILVYRASGGVPLSRIGDASAAAFIASFAVFLLINSVCVSWAIAIVTEEDFFELWKKSTLGDLPYDFLALPVILFFVWIYSNFGPVGALFLTVPLLGMRQLSLLNSKLEQTNRELLDVMIAAIEARDPYTSGHSRRVAANARIIGRAIGLKTRDVERISVAALLHDVGKIHEVFGPILSKPGRLTPEENAIMKTHPIKSEELAATVSELKDVLPLIRHHHENWDGSGYPDGLKSDEIPLGSRIIMFADTIDAMTTDRPYRAALAESAVRNELQKFRGSQFDPEIYDRLLASSDFSLLFRGAKGDLPLRARALREPPLDATKLA